MIACSISGTEFDSSHCWDWQKSKQDSRDVLIRSSFFVGIGRRGIWKDALLL